MDNIYYEYKGMGWFNDMPILGGLEECDRRRKTKWRKHFTPADQKRFGWITMLAKAVDNQVANKGSTVEGCIG